MKKPVYTALDGGAIKRNCPSWLSALMVLCALLFSSTPNMAQCTLGCNDLVQVSLDQDCWTEVTANMLLNGQNTSCPDGQFEVTIMDDKGKPLPSSPWVGAANIGKTYTVKVSDKISGQSCWSSILVEDKMKPSIVCQDITIDCNVTDLHPDSIGGVISITDNCDPDAAWYTTWTDQLTDLPCGGQFSAYIVRTFIAKDAWGNIGTCSHKIWFKRASLYDVKCPLNLDDVELPALSCENPNISPSNTGYPTINGKPIGGYCEINATYNDLKIPSCDGTYKILRQWTILDWCEQLTATCTQIIKVSDHKGPKIECPKNPDQTVKVLGVVPSKYNSCTAKVSLPPATVSDNCTPYTALKFLTYAIVDGIQYAIPTNGGILEVPFGNHTFYYVAYDGCGNSSYCSIKDIEVADIFPPVAACEEFYKVGLTDSITYVNAFTFDDGSYDDCSKVTFKARRMESSGCPFEDASDFDDKVPFYCCDCGTPVMVQLRVYDAWGNYNDCMVTVTVEDKIKPVIWCPDDITVQCNTPYEPTVPATFTKTVSPSIAISSVFAKKYSAPVNITGLPENAKITDINVGMSITHEFIDQLKINLVSPKGTSVPLFVGGSCGMGQQDINGTFDDEGNKLNCASGYPAIKGNVKPNAGLLSLFDGENPNSIKLPAGFKDWVLEVEDTAPLGGGSINGITLTISYVTPLGYTPIVDDNTKSCGLKVTWKDLDTPEQCPGTVVRRQWKVEDKGGLTSVCTQKLLFVDPTPWDVTFPMDVTVYDCKSPDDLKAVPGPTHNGDCEMVAINHEDVIYNVVPDACYKIERIWTLLNWCTYDAKGKNTPLGITLPGKNKYRDNGDGYFYWVQTIKVKDTLAPIIQCPNDLTVGIQTLDCGPDSIDIPAIPVVDCSPNIKTTISYDFYNDGTINKVKFKNEPSSYMPIGKHKVHVKMEDGCGNFSFCDFLVTIVDVKKPVAICQDIHIDIMSMGTAGQITISPEMIDKASWDNCTPKNKLKFKVTPNVFTCDNLGVNEVTLVVIDEQGNFDECKAKVDVQDNNNWCNGNTMSTITGVIKDATSNPIKDAEVVLNDPTYPSQLTNANGEYSFTVAANKNFNVITSKNSNPLNGVNTQDLLMIQKHLLNITPLNSPLKMIAADANNNKAITVADIVQLRQLILHIIPNFTSNTSWRFIEGSYNFPDPKNPWKETIPENCSVNGVPANGKVVNFIAVKVGDVTGNANGQSATASEARDGKVLTLHVKDQSFKAGDVIEIPFMTSQPLSGFQGTFQFDPTMCELMEVIGNEKIGFAGANVNAQHAENGLIATSWNTTGEAVETNVSIFTLRLRATADGMLSQMLSVNSAITPAEVYDANTNAADLALEVRSQNASTQGITLLQNMPNPFNQSTRIGFVLPEDGPATLLFHDASGKTLKTITGEYHKGFNEVTVRKSDIGVNGVVYYRIDTRTGTATRKMIIFE